jgi:hypothetical protein
VSSLILSLQAEISAGALLLRYGVQNRGARDVYLLNRLFSSSPRRMSPDIAYVEVDPQTQLVHVFKGIPQIPPGASGPPVPMAPYVTPVRAGADFAETVRIALPVRVYRAYGRSPRPGPPNSERIAEYRGVDFKLAWYERGDGVVEVEDMAFDQHVIVPARFRTPPTVELSTTNVVPLAIPVVVPSS